MKAPKVSLSLIMSLLDDPAAFLASKSAHAFLNAQALMLCTNADIAESVNP